MPGPVEVLRGRRISSAACIERGIHDRKRRMNASGLLMRGRLRGRKRIIAVAVFSQSAPALIVDV